MRRMAMATAMAMAMAMCIVAAGCGSENFQVPLGFVGSIGMCHADRAEGSLRLDDGGWVHAEKLGHGSVHCKNGGAETVGVRTPATLVLDGPDTIDRDDAVYYRLQVRGAHGEDLSIVDESRIDWRGSPNADVHPAYCSDMPLFGCPGMDSARVRVGAGAAAEITVRYLGLVVTKRVTVH